MNMQHRYGDQTVCRYKRKNRGKDFSCPILRRAVHTLGAMTARARSTTLILKKTSKHDDSHNFWSYQEDIFSMISKHMNGCLFVMDI